MGFQRLGVISFSQAEAAWRGLFLSMEMAAAVMGVCPRQGSRGHSPGLSPKPATSDAPQATPVLTALPPLKPGGCKLKCYVSALYTVAWTPVSSASPWLWLSRLGSPVWGRGFPPLGGSPSWDTPLCPRPAARGAGHPFHAAALPPVSRWLLGSWSTVSSSDSLQLVMQGDCPPISLSLPDRFWEALQARPTYSATTLNLRSVFFKLFPPK